MPNDSIEEQLKAYRADSRTACQYGSKCYQKNPAHRTKYKHPPKKQQKDSKKDDKIVTGRKRSSSECDEDEAGTSTLPQAKLRKDDESHKEARTHSMSPSPPPDIEDSSNPENEEDASKTSMKKDSFSDEETSSKKDQSPRKKSPKKDQSPRKNSPKKHHSPGKNFLEKEQSLEKDSPKKDRPPEKNSPKKDRNLEEDSPTKDSLQKDRNSEEDSPEKNRNSEEDSPEKDRNSEEDSSEKDRSPEKDSQASARNGGSASDSPQGEITDETSEEVSEEIASGAPSSDPKKIISDLFLVEMPDDFYKFYEFCAGAYPTDPSTALKLVDLKLVGPYDVLNGKITTNKQREPEKYLRHWRYYYDPPEFQTILKGNDRDGLHYGYWRDSPEEKPVFVATNSANKDCIISPVAPNIFGAVNSHIEERLKKANPFEKGPIVKLSKQLKSFAKDKGIELDKDDPEMRNRSRKVVAKTFHRAGIVVPYNKKTQLGYRDLAATDSQIKKILNQIDGAESDDDRIKAMSKIEEIVRLAVIAADECDFGTCLELGHDLFSSGVRYVQRTSLQVLGSAYNLLNRQKFLKIAQAHLKDRKKGCDLSVL